MAYGRLAGVLGSDGTGPDAYRRSMEAAAAQGVVGLVDLEFSGGVADWAERWAEGADLLRIRHACYADGLDDVLARGLRSGDPLDGDPRLTMGPLKIISDGSLNTRTAWCCEPYAEKAVPGVRGGPAQPDARGAARAARPRRGRRARRRRARDRRPRGHRGARRLRGDRRPRRHRARAAHHARRRTPHGRARRPRQRAARPPPRRPRRHRAALAGPRRALLPAALDARRRRRRGARLGRAGLAARPVAGGRGRGPPLGRRARAVAPRAVDHRPRGARRLDRRLGHGRRRPPRRPRAARRRPARRGRPTASTPPRCGPSPTTSSRPGSPARRRTRATDRGSPSGDDCPPRCASGYAEPGVTAAAAAGQASASVASSTKAGSSSRSP